MTSPPDLAISAAPGRKAEKLKVMLMNRILAIAATAIAVSPQAKAQVTNIGDVAAGLQTQAGSIADLIGAAAFLLGIGLGIVGLLKFRQHAQNPNDPSAKLSSAFTLVFVGAALVAIPTTLGVGVSSLFGSGATNVTVDGTLRNIN